MSRISRTQVVRGEVAGSHWELAWRSPVEALQPHVRRLCGYDERAPRPRQQRQFPTPMVVVIIELGPPLRVSVGGDEATAGRHTGGFAAGLGDAYTIVGHEGRQRGIQVDLGATGARRLFGLPMSELAGRAVALADLLPGAHLELVEQLAALPDWASRLDRVEAWLATVILAAPIDTKRVDWALACIEAQGGALRAGELARELGCSRKHLISLFRDQVGVPPKLVAQLVRFDRLMAEAARGRATRWIELALDAGYCDQAHLSRDVRRFTGLTPTEARRQYPDLVALLS